MKGYNKREWKKIKKQYPGVFTEDKGQAEWEKLREAFDEAYWKDTYPMALPVFSVVTPKEAMSLFILSAPKSYDSPRYGLPAILQENTKNMDKLSEHLHNAYQRMRKINHPLAIVPTP